MIGYLRLRFFPFRLITSAFFTYGIAAAAIVQSNYRSPIEILLVMCISMMFIDITMFWYLPRYIFRLVKFFVFVVMYRENVMMTWNTVMNAGKDWEYALLVEAACDKFEQRIETMRSNGGAGSDGRVSKKDVEDAAKKLK